MDDGAFDESMMFNEYHQKPGSPTHHQHQPLLAFQQPGDMMGYALPVPDHMDMHHHHQLQDMDMHRHHHHNIQDQIQQQQQQQQQDNRQIQIGDPQDLFQMPVTSAAQVIQPADIVNAVPNGQKHIKLEMDANSLPVTGQQSSGTYMTKEI